MPGVWLVGAGASPGLLVFVLQFRVLQLLCQTEEGKPGGENVPSPTSVSCGRLSYLHGGKKGKTVYPDVREQGYHRFYPGKGQSTLLLVWTVW